MPTVIYPNGMGSRDVKNLGWILRRRQDVVSVHITRIANLVTWTLKDGRLYYCDWADMSVMHDWMLQYFPEQYLAARVAEVTGEVRKELEVMEGLLDADERIALRVHIKQLDRKLDGWK